MAAMELTQDQVQGIMVFLEQNAGEVFDTAVAAHAQINTQQLIGDRYPWYYYVDPQDGRAKIRHQNLGPPSGSIPDQASVASAAAQANAAAQAFEPSAGACNGSTGSGTTLANPSASYGAAQGSGGFRSGPYDDGGKGRGSKVMGIIEQAQQVGLTPAVATDEDKMYAEQFLSQHQVDEHAARAFRECAPQVQRIVMNKGSMQGARDQTAVLMDRIRKGTEAVTTGTVSTSSWAYAQPGDWTCPNCLDLQFTRNVICRKCGTPNPNLNSNAGGMQSGGMHGGCMQGGGMQGGCMHSGGMQGSMQGGMHGMQGGMQGGAQTNTRFSYQNPALAQRTEQDQMVVESFLTHCQVEQHAADMLRNMAPNLQRMVVDKGTLEGGRDQTSVLITRMNQVMQSGAVGTSSSLVPGSMEPNKLLVPGAGKTFEKTKQGDWVCPGCMDLQFARNAVCRKCQTPNPQLQMCDPAVDEFLLVNGIEDHAALRFKSLDRRTQEMIMSRGPLDGARDKTAVLMGRMRQADEGTLSLRSGEQPQIGDWYCPNCNDLQFKRNRQCRRCGTPHPGNGNTVGGGMQNTHGMQGMQNMQAIDNVPHQFGGMHNSFNNHGGMPNNFNQGGMPNNFNNQGGMPNNFNNQGGMPNNFNNQGGMPNNFDSQGGAIPGQGGNVQEMQNMMQRLSGMMQKNSPEMNQQLIQQLATMAGQEGAV